MTPADLEALPGFSDRWTVRMLHLFEDEAHVAAYGNQHSGRLSPRVLLLSGVIAWQPMPLVCGTCGLSIHPQTLIIDPAWSWPQYRDHAS
jgi:hypothetical protein